MHRSTSCVQAQRWLADLCVWYLVSPAAHRSINVDNRLLSQEDVFSFNFFSTEQRNLLLLDAVVVMTFLTLFLIIL
jgi:hypothetical protein